MSPDELGNPAARKYDIEVNYLTKLSFFVALITITTFYTVQRPIYRGISRRLKLRL